MTLTKYNTGSQNQGKNAPQEYRILYVEDEDQNWEIDEAGLRTKYSMTRARDARETFKALSTQSFDLVLMDIQLCNSDLDGIEITQALRGTLNKDLPVYARTLGKTDIPIIFVSAYNARYTKEELRQVGGDELIPKPVDFTRLSLAISRCLMRKAQDSMSRPH